jgi:hypothetical protein
VQPLNAWSWLQNGSAIEGLDPGRDMSGGLMEARFIQGDHQASGLSAKNSAPNFLQEDGIRH